MPPRHPSLLDVPVAFAHRGASAHARENTLEAFALALRLGANGLESDVWVTRDGTAVLDHDGKVRAGFRRRRFATVDRSRLPAHVPALSEVVTQLGHGFHLSLDVKDPAAAAATATALAPTGFPLSRLWLCSPGVEVLEMCRRSVPGARLVHSTRMKRLGSSFEQHCAALRDRGVDAINLHHSEWTGGNVVLAHRFGLCAFAWDLQHHEHLVAILAMGIDAVYSDHVDLMTEVYTSVVGPPVRPA